MKLIHLFNILLLFNSAHAQPTDGLWEPFRFFLGKWEGEGEGKSGRSVGQQEFDLVLRDRYLSIRNKSVFEPQEQNPNGETHEDFGFISYDRNRQSFVFRRFHVEGFVNHYVLQHQGEDPTTLVFVSESIENIPQGFRARITYKILGPDSYSISFDLASPGGEFDCYSAGEMRRIKK